MGAISAYYNRINLEVQLFASKRDIFKKIEEDNSEKLKKENRFIQSAVPSLFQLASKAVESDWVDISRAPDEIQINYLETKTNFKNWREAQFFCLSKNSTLITRKILKLHHMESQDPDRDLLSALFKGMYQASSPYTKERIINLKRAAQPIRSSTKMYLRELSEKIVQTLSNPKFLFVLRCAAVGITYGLVAVYSAIKIDHAWQKFILEPILLLPTPLNTIVTFSEAFFTVAILINACKPGCFGHTFHKVFNYTFGAPSILATFSAKKVNALFQSFINSQKMKTVVVNWNNLRLGHEYCEARDLWITLCLNERALKRAEVEYEYAEEEAAYNKQNHLPVFDAHVQLAKAQMDLNRAKAQLLPV